MVNSAAAITLGVLIFAQSSREVEGTALRSLGNHFPAITGGRCQFRQIASGGDVIYACALEDEQTSLSMAPL